MEVSFSRRATAHAKSNPMMIRRAAIVIIQFVVEIVATVFTPPA
jgi:hypothetical protein